MKVAEVKPSVVSTAAPVKQLAGSYAARLTAIKAAKAAEAAASTKKSTEETVGQTPKPAPSPKAVPVRAKITGPSPAAPKPVQKQVSAPAKSITGAKDSPAETKVKRTFTPIAAPSPDPVAPVSRFKSAPVQNFAPPKVETVCRFWPQCKWKDACRFSHPPVKASPEAVLATSANVSKFKWSAK